MLNDIIRVSIDIFALGPRAGPGVPSPPVGGVARSGPLPTPGTLTRDPRGTSMPPSPHPSVRPAVRPCRRPDHRAPVGRLLAALAGLVALAAPVTAGPWTSISPGGGGAFTAIAGGPTGILICGADLSGAYRSLDGGATWDRIGSDRGLKRTHVSAVAFDPADPQVVHLGTEVGIYRSGDGGGTFTRVLDTGYIGAVAVSPSDPAVVYAGYHDLWETTASNVYRSLDRGLTWTPVATALPAGLRILELIVSPHDPGTVYAVSGADLFVAGQPSVHVSADSGATWTRLGESLGDLWDLAVDPVTPGTLYVTSVVGAPPTAWSGATHKSTDGGVTWTQKSAHTGAVVVRRDQPQTVRVIDVRRKSSEAESGVWESLDGGDTWSRKSTMQGWDPGWQALDWAYGGGAYGMPKVLGQDLSDPDAILWVSWQFAFASRDGGGSFANLNTTQVQPGRWLSRGLDNITVTSIAIGEPDPSRVYVGFHDLGFWRSLDGGASWRSANPQALTGSWKGKGGHTSTILADPDRAEVVWASFGGREDSLRLARSAAAGDSASWVAVAGLPVGLLRGLSLDRNSPVAQRTLFVTANGDVHRSDDDGLSWTLALDCDSCRTTAVDRYDPQLVYAGGEGGLWRSLAGGAPGTWSRIGPAEFAGVNTKAVQYERWEGVHRVIADPIRPGAAYVAAHGPGRGIYRSTDRGETWTRLRAGTYMRDVAADPVAAGVLYAAGSRAFKSGSSVTGSEGVERSTDGGQTWTALNDGLPWPFAARIAIDPANHHRLVLGSPGSGYFTRTMAGAVVGVGTPGEGGAVALSPAFPSPARGGVSFVLTLPREAAVEWSVHDLQGRRLWGEALRAGAGVATLRFDRGAVAGPRPGGGVYFARVRVDGRTLTRRFTLLP